MNMANLKTMGRRANLSKQTTLTTEEVKSAIQKLEQYHSEPDPIKKAKLFAEIAKTENFPVLARKEEES